MTKNIKPADYVITPDVEVSDIDLEAEEFHLPDGRRLTEDLAEQIAAETLEEVRKRNLVPGGKSLSGDGSHSPTVAFRVPAAIRSALHERAKHEGKSQSAIARDALIKYLHAS